MSEITEKGNAAVKRITDRYLNNANALQNLRNDITQVSGNGGTAISSCSFTAEVTGKTARNVAMDGLAPLTSVNLSGKSQAERVNVIKDNLGSAQLVYVNVVPDHHFNIIPIDTDKVVVVQGFQGVYNLVEYLTNRGVGIIKKDELISAFNDMVGSDATARKAGAVKLFSYALADSSETTVKGEVEDYYKDSATIQSIGVGALP